jgi:hypothetical protein
MSTGIKNAPFLRLITRVAEPKLFFCRSGSDFQKVSAPATALKLPVIKDFMLKRLFFMFLMKEN